MNEFDKLVSLFKKNKFGFIATPYLSILLIVYSTLTSQDVWTLYILMMFHAAIIFEKVYQVLMAFILLLILRIGILSFQKNILVWELMNLYLYP
jgi:hypothetical protein